MFDELSVAFVIVISRIAPPAALAFSSDSIIVKSEREITPSQKYVLHDQCKSVFTQNTLLFTVTAAAAAPHTQLWVYIKNTNNKTHVCTNLVGSLPPTNDEE